MNDQALSIVMMVGIIAVFFLLMILPQRKRKKQMQAMMDSLTPGKSIKTIGGLYGKIVAVKEDLITIEVPPDKTRLVYSKSAVASVEDSEIEENSLDKK